MYMTLHIPVPADSVAGVSAETIRRRGPASLSTRRDTGQRLRELTAGTQFPKGQPKAIGEAGASLDGQALPDNGGRGLIGATLHRGKALVERLFPDRQLFVRANDHVNFLALSRRTQLVIAGIGVLVIGWTIAATAMLYGLNRTIDARDARLARQRVAYDKLVGDVAAYQDKVGEVTRSLRDRQARLLSLFEPGSGPNIAAEGTAGGREARAALHSQIRQLDGELGAMTDMSVALEDNLADVRQRLAAAMAERDQVAMARAELTQRLQETQRRERGEAERNATLRDTLGRTLQQLNQATNERDQMERERTFYRDKLRETERDIAEGQETQQNLVYRLVERAADSIQEAERIVALTGIDVSGHVRSAGAGPTGANQGGPFLPLDRTERPLEPTQSAMALLDLQLDRWDGLQHLLRAIPFAPPLDAFSVTSTYGSRVDPFTQTASMHQGIDMSAPRRTPVFVGAPGKVLFANRKDRYGRMIEIDHGMGIVTRYAHLDEILVKAGDKVGFRTKIGLVGSSGRTSGAHLHYEVVVKGKPMDPQRFMDVGKHLFKEVDVADIRPAAGKKTLARPRSSVAKN